MDQAWTGQPRPYKVDETSQAMREGYPALMRDAGIAGEVEVWMFVNEHGRVDAAEINESSGWPELDRVALNAARLMEFTPALNGDSPVAVWVAMPFSFGPLPALPRDPNPEDPSF